MRFVPLAAGLLLGAALAQPLAAQASEIRNILLDTSFVNPVQVLAAPGQDDYLYVVEQRQHDIHVFDLNTNSVIATFLNLNGKVNSGANERGLLGLAFHPDYENNGYLFVNYTNLGGSTVVERYTRDGTDPLKADPSSGLQIISFSQPQSNHNGGALTFGPDGMLWIATGDGGGANDSGTGHAAGGNAQSGTTLLGKMLRLDVDGGTPYAIPADNPYLSDGSVLDEIWAIGLRNPWRFDFDRATGDLWIADVGQGAREEVNWVSDARIQAIAGGVIAPLNFGWRCREGFLCTGLTGCSCSDPTLTPPIKDYDTGGSQSVTGGYVYRGTAMPDWVGHYFYADYQANEAFSLKWNGSTLVSDLNQSTNLNGFIGRISAFGIGPDDELYFVRHNNGDLRKIVPEGDFFGLGNGLAGAAGEPVHWGTGGMGPGEPGALHLAEAAPSAFAGIFLALSEGAANFKGGTLVAFPFSVLKFANTNASGEITLPWTDLGSLPSGLEVISQWAVTDAGAPSGVALSNGLRATVP